MMAVMVGTFQSPHNISSLAADKIVSTTACVLYVF